MKKNRPVRTLILIMIALVVLGLGIAWWYYKGINESVDPRVAEALKLYEKYNEFAQLSQYDSVFWLMDKIEDIYNNADHYKNSYEIGVLYNNRAATYLSVFLNSLNQQEYSDTSGLLEKAQKSAEISIKIYNNWITTYTNKNGNEIRGIIRENFIDGLGNYELKQQEKYLDKRVKEIMEAQIEIDRRLSVSYTNLGIIKRHQQKYDSAAILYNKALKLWDRNLTAENNLNILLNKPMRKPNIIQRLFPPDKKEE